MSGFSRRQLAKYAVDEIIAKRPASELSAHLAAALAAGGRQKEVELLLSDIDQELEERGLVANARLTSAYPLSSKLKQELSARLKKMAGVKDVIMQEQVDKSAIGGFRVETASRSWDKTFARTLAKLKEDG